jgi:hypothetical protein
MLAVTNQGNLVLTLKRNNSNLQSVFLGRGESMSKFLRFSWLCLAICVTLSADLHACGENSCLSGLASPKGVAVVGLVYGITSGVSNFLWAFDWEKHSGVDSKTKATIQEWGGITAAIENWILGFTIPLMVYLHTAQNPVEAEKI